MGRYVPAVRTADPHALEGLQPGQWIEYATGEEPGALGRYYGRRNGVVWIAWGAAARRRFATFARAARVV